MSGKDEIKKLQLEYWQAMDLLNDAKEEVIRLDCLTDELQEKIDELEAQDGTE